jgi:hypothetical protein
MFLRVKFCDNDFSTEVNEACESIMSELSRGYKGEEAITRYKEAVKSYSLENIRKAIVLSAYGYYIASKGTRSYSDVQDKYYKVSQYENILEYLDENISIEEIKNFDQEWENSEVCYIDFYSKTVHLQ